MSIRCYECNNSYKPKRNLGERQGGHFKCFDCFSKSKKITVKPKVEKSLTKVNPKYLVGDIVWANHTKDGLLIGCVAGIICTEPPVTYEVDFEDGTSGRMYENELYLKPEQAAYSKAVTFSRD